MQRLFTIFFTVAPLLLAVAPAALAQTAGPSTAYLGPRFPGGPDSLRALVYRSSRLGFTAAEKQVCIRFELTARGKPGFISMLTRPQSYKIEPAIALALQYLQARMPPWVPGTSALETNPTIRLMLDFTTPLSAQPYAYADQNPALPEAKALARAQHRHRTPIALEYAQQSLIRYIQQQVAYPPAALRQRLQGVVYTYFEVAENGAIERPMIVGSAGEALDVEVLKALRELPTATVPATLHGQSVRVYYVLPITFKIQ